MLNCNKGIPGSNPIVEIGRDPFVSFVTRGGLSDSVAAKSSNHIMRIFSVDEKAKKVSNLCSTGPLRKDF